jgi:phosphorylcholine metabolism protein LicD
VKISNNKAPIENSILSVTKKNPMSRLKEKFLEIFGCDVTHKYAECSMDLSQKRNALEMMRQKRKKANVIHTQVCSNFTVENPKWNFE